MDDFGEKKNLCPFRYPDAEHSSPWSGHCPDCAIPISLSMTLVLSHTYLKLYNDQLNAQVIYLSI
jgi:hypothetical protein